MFKLCQTYPLRDNIAEVRKLANRTSDVDHILLKSCFFLFIFGLKRELNYPVKLFRPANIHETIVIIVQLDIKFIELKVG